MLFAHDNALLTDIGYPEQTDAFNYRLFGYFTNTIAHNTVTVDGAMQSRGPGVLHAFSTHGFAQVVDASCEGAYPGQVSLYRRVNVLVQVTPDQKATSSTCSMFAAAASTTMRCTARKATSPVNPVWDRRRRRAAWPGRTCLTSSSTMIPTSRTSHSAASHTQGIAEAGSSS